MWNYHGPEREEFLKNHDWETFSERDLRYTEAEICAWKETQAEIQRMKKTLLKPTDYSALLQTCVDIEYMEKGCRRVVIYNRFEKRNEIHHLTEDGEDLLYSDSENDFLDENDHDDEWIQ
jgi:hypothetical protein